MKQPMWNSDAVKAYETGQGVELVNEPYPHYVPSQKKREWVRLTEYQIDELEKEFIGFPVPNIYNFVQAIEAMLKERNT